MQKLANLWTRSHTLTMLALITAVPGLVAASLYGTPSFAAVVSAIFIVLWVVSIITTPFIGLIAGIVGGAFGVAFDVMSSLAAMPLVPKFIYAVSAATTALYAGLAGRRLRWNERPTFLPEPSIYPDDPILGPHGFLNDDYGSARLDEEVERAHMFDRPLSLLSIEIRTSSDTSGDHKYVERAVARTVEGVLRKTDIPIALSSGQLICILPETDRSKGEMLLGLLRDRFDEIAITAPGRTGVAPIREMSKIVCGLVTYPEDGTTMSALVASMVDAQAIDTAEMLPDATVSSDDSKNVRRRR